MGGLVGQPPGDAKPDSRRSGGAARLVAAGLSNRQIADELLLSLQTVRTYLRRMSAKLGINDRTHLAVLAHQPACCTTTADPGS
ncbi:response regulator transcription factor [Actinoplanes sp. NPDC051343]|uniref:response regulator transcription factor n=1 Tax=Actinoplanes sp. NPDC051343 TaxID=3363906 RepID=UPI00378C148E